jgi:hypothetical protein
MNYKRRDILAAATPWAAGLCGSPKLPAHKSVLFPGFTPRKISTPD